MKTDYINLTVRKPSIAIVKKALKTFGYMIVDTGNGKTRKIREIASVRGFWRTGIERDAYGNMREHGYGRPESKLGITQVAQGWLDHEAEIMAEREAAREAFAMR